MIGQAKPLLFKRPRNSNNRNNKNNNTGQHSEFLAIFHLTLCQRSCNPLNQFGFISFYFSDASWATSRGLTKDWD